MIFSPVISKSMVMNSFRSWENYSRLEKNLQIKKQAIGAEWCGY